MFAALRLLPAVFVAAAGYFAADALLKRSRHRNAKTDLNQDLKTWEGEGGNLPPAQAKQVKQPTAAAA
jgi:hypothetical protein